MFSRLYEGIKMSNERSKLLVALLKEQSMTIDSLAAELKVSTDFIRGIAAGGDTFSLKDDFVLLNGLGESRCIICSNLEYMDERNYGWRWAVNIKIPDELLRGYVINNGFPREIRGHKKCLSTIDAWFRFKEGFICYDCSSFRGQWVDGDEVVEECSIMKQREVGHRGIMAGEYMCNYFQPDREVREKRVEKWEKIKPEIEARTQKGYQALIAHLEKLRFLRAKETAEKSA